MIKVRTHNGALQNIERLSEVIAVEPRKYRFEKSISMKYFIQKIKRDIFYFFYYVNKEHSKRLRCCRYGHFSGINRKVQMKYQPKGRPRGSSSDDGKYA